jgi:hypothetical protein
MNIRIPIPAWLLRIWDRFGDWGNVLVWSWRRWYLVRLDLLLAASFVLSASYYGYSYGWRGAAQSAGMFTFVAMCALFFRPERTHGVTYEKSEKAKEGEA